MRKLFALLAVTSLAVLSDLNIAMAGKCNDALLSDHNLSCDAPKDFFKYARGSVLEIGKSLLQGFQLEHVWHYYTFYASSWNRPGITGIGQWGTEGSVLMEPIKKLDSDYIFTYARIVMQAVGVISDELSSAVHVYIQYDYSEITQLAYKVTGEEYELISTTVIDDSDSNKKAPFIYVGSLEDRKYFYDPGVNGGLIPVPLPAAGSGLGMLGIAVCVLVIRRRMEQV